MLISVLKRATLLRKTVQVLYLFGSIFLLKFENRHGLKQKVFNLLTRHFGNKFLMASNWVYKPN